MSYPKKHKTIFIQLEEFDCRQVNIHLGTKYNYWFISPNKLPFKLKKGDIPDILKGHDLGLKDGMGKINR